MPFCGPQEVKQVSLPIDLALFQGSDVVPLERALLITFSERLAQVGEEAGLVLHPGDPL